MSSSRRLAVPWLMMAWSTRYMHLFLPLVRDIVIYILDKMFTILWTWHLLLHQYINSCKFVYADFCWFILEVVSCTFLCCRRSSNWHCSRQIKRKAYLLIGYYFFWLFLFDNVYLQDIGIAFSIGWTRFINSFSCQYILYKILILIWFLIAGVWFIWYKTQWNIRLWRVCSCIICISSECPNWW